MHTCYVVCKGNASSHVLFAVFSAFHIHIPDPRDVCKLFTTHLAKTKPSSALLRAFPFLRSKGGNSSLAVAEGEEWMRLKYESYSDDDKLHTWYMSHIQACICTLRRKYIHTWTLLYSCWYYYRIFCNIMRWRECTYSTLNCCRQFFVSCASPAFKRAVVKAFHERAEVMIEVLLFMLSLSSYLCYD